MRIVLLVFFLGISFIAQLSAADSTYFRSPVLHDIVLAGSFGELRTSHFHAGIDIKPSSKNMIGDTIVAAAAGYVSRIKVQAGGYGQALYIDHDNGYTTVYAHLEDLAEPLSTYVQEMQLSTRSYGVDLYLDSTSFVIERGAFIGTMGNRGRSYAPHLHFEIRKTNSETPQDPALWGITAPDHKSPTLQSIGIEGLTPDLRKTLQKIYYPNNTASIDTIRIPAWQVGIDVQAYDQMDGSTNRNGVYRREVWLDDTLHWSATTDSVQWDATQYITTYYDYADKQQLNRTAVCAYTHPGNCLHIYGKRGGPIKLYRDRPRTIKVVLADLAGNITSKTLALLRDPQIAPPSWPSYQQIIRWDSTYVINMGRVTIEIDSGTFVRDVYWSYEDDGKYLHLHKKNIDPYRPINASIELNTVDSSFRSHYCLVYHDNKRPTSYGGHIDSIGLHTSITALGRYSVVVDTIAPSISKSTLTADEGIYLVSDNLGASGTANDVAIDVYIDGVWQITPYKTMTKELRVPLSHLGMGVHELEIIATDDRGNKSTLTESISIEK